MEADSHPEILNHKLYFDKHELSTFTENIQGKPLEEKRYYSIDELLSHMIINSDNDAAFLLAKNLNVRTYKKFFSDLGLAEPDIFRQEYYTNVIDCIKMFRVIYNGSYVGRQMSEYALDMLTKCEYKEGLLRGVDAGVPVARGRSVAGRFVRPIRARFCPRRRLRRGDHRG